MQNAYPNHLFDNILRKFLNSKYETQTKLTTVNKEVRYLKLPFVGHVSFTIRKQLLDILKHSFPQIDFRIVFTNSFKVSSLLRKPKERPFNVTSNCVYLFSCSCCTARYIGSSIRWLTHRICDHKWISNRTSFPLFNPPFSAIREHSENSDHNFTDRDFSILSVANNRSDLLILESLYIEKMKPSLNRQTTAVQLYTK